MKSLFKVSVSVVLLFVLVFMAACGGTQKAPESKAPQNSGQSAAPQAAEDKKVVLKVGGIQAVEDFSTQAMKKLAELASQKSGGTLEIQVYPASQLGAATNQIEAVSMGSQDMFIDAGSFMATFVPDKNVESMFFLFRDEDHYRKYLNSDIMKGFEDKFLEKKGVRVIANNWVRIPRSTTSKKPVNSADDFKGLKTRVPDIKGYLESVSALEAKPTQIAWGETYLALKQGVVDAAEGPMDSLYTMKFYEATKSISVTEHLRDNMVVIINDKKFNTLSQKQKDALVAASKEAGDWYSSSVKQALNGFLDKMKAEGTQFIQPDLAPMRSKVAERAKKLEQSGLWAAGLFEKIQALK